MKNLIQRLLPMGKGPTPGLHTVRSSKHKLALERVAQGGGRELEMFNPEGISLLRLDLDGKSSAVSYMTGYKRVDQDAPRKLEGQVAWQEMPGSETAAQELYDRMRKGFLGGTSGGRFGPLPAMAMGAFGVVALALLLSGPSGQSAQASARIPGLPPGATIGPYGVIAPTGANGAQAAANPAAGARGAAQPQLVPGEAMLTADERKTLAGLKGVVSLKAKGKEFYVFSDPNCPHCRSFEQTLAQVPADFKPVIVPVAFQPGSREKAVAVLCSSDPAGEWKHVMAGNQPRSKTCEEGEKRLTENETRFREFRLTATPTTVSPLKSLLVSAAATPEELGLILKN